MKAELKAAPLTLERKAATLRRKRKGNRGWPVSRGSMRQKTTTVSYVQIIACEEGRQQVDHGRQRRSLGTVRKTQRPEVALEGAAEGDEM